MDDSAKKEQGPKGKPRMPGREIANPALFSDSIVFSDTEKILFEEDLQEKPSARKDLMDGNPAERYTPHRKLNQGGMKAIWEVDDHRTARKVAMALIQDFRIASSEDIDAFLYEARLTANLQHPNIIPIYDIAVDENGNPYFTMKALKGETLGEIVAKLRAGDREYLARYSRTRLLGIFIKVCNAIDYAHTKGVIHLDLKPSNVIVGDFGDVHVLDWGLSTLVTHLEDCNEPVSWKGIGDASLENGQTLTRYLENTSKHRQAIGGTPGYMSPEQARGVPSAIGFQTDVYMLGAMLYEILTYRCPIEGDTVKDVLQKTVRGDLLPPAKRSPQLRIPPALAAIAMKAMSLEPQERYAGVAALIRDVNQYLDGFATIAENPTFITHFMLLIRRHKLVAGLLAGSALVIGVIMANSYASIKATLADLQEKNDYIAATARKVAPDYLDLAQRAEREHAFEDAEQAIETCLAFDPENPAALDLKARMLISQQRFAEAWAILNGGHAPEETAALRRLAETYLGEGAVADELLPQFVADLRAAGMDNEIPRLFYHANTQPFVSETRFPALAASLGILNPLVANPRLEWKATNSGWSIDIGDNPGLDDISPLCGLKIEALEADRIGSPNLELLVGTGLRKLNLAHAPLNNLFDLDRFADLEELNLQGTNIRNISNIVKYPKITTLNISDIDGLSITPQLVWNRNLRLLTVSAAFRNDPTIQSLARRGVIINYTER